MRRDLFGANWEPILAAQTILHDAIREHRPTHIFALFSGGHDSLCSTHVVSQMQLFSGVATLFTGIGIRQTRRYVYETCKRYRWPLRVYRPRKGNRYHEMVSEYGFPGKAQHGVAYVRLKERQLDRLIAEHKRGRRDRIILVTGVRVAESRRRMGTSVPVRRDGSTVWVAPIIDWEQSDKHWYMDKYHLPRNEVVDLLHRSGECNCGAFGSPEELAEMRYWYPKDAAKIDELAASVRDRFSWSWGENPPAMCRFPDPTQRDLELCQSCESRGAA